MLHMYVRIESQQLTGKCVSKCDAKTDKKLASN